MMTVKELREKLLGDVDYTDIKDIVDEFEQGVQEERIEDMKKSLESYGDEYAYCKGRIHALERLLGDDLNENKGEN